MAELYAVAGIMCDGCNKYRPFDHGRYIYGVAEQGTWLGEAIAWICYRCQPK